MAALGAVAGQPPRGDEPAAPDEPSPAGAGTDDRPQAAPPATTFTPSERIGADSAVSFPVDI
jgi:hypothetical protein